MRLVKEFLISDIIKYENNEDINIMTELACAEPFICIDMIMLGNKCSYEEAVEIFSEALNEMTLEDIAKEIIKCLIPVQETETDKNVEVDENTKFSDILEDFYEQLQIVDDKISITEFKDMSTRYLYKYADGLNKRCIAKANSEYRNQYSHVAMFMSALAGKLKECPQLNEDGTLHKTSLKEKIQAIKGR